MWIAGPRRRVNLALSGFFLLIAANQVTETLRAFVSTEWPPVPGSIALYRVAHVFSSLDPLLLFLFAFFHFGPVSGPPARRDAAALAAVAAASVALAAWSIWVQPPETSQRWLLAEQVDRLFTLAIYGGVLWRVRSALLAAPERPDLHLLLPALSLAAVPVFCRFLWTMTHLAWRVLDWRREGFLGPLTILLPLAALLPLMVWTRRRVAPGVRLLVAGSLLGSFGLALALNYYDLRVGLLGQPYQIDPLFYGVYLSSASIRWLLFGVLVSMAVIRYDLLGLNLAMRRLAARVLLGLAFLLGAGALLGLQHAARGGGRFGLRGVDVLVLGAAVLASQWFRTLLDRSAATVYGLPRPRDPGAAAEAYGAAVAQAVREGRDGPDGPLGRLRRELGIDDATADTVERAARASAGEPPAAGRIVGGRYRVVRPLGPGRVFLAQDTLLARDVVVKEIAAGDGLDEVALWEARAAGGLQHPNVVTVHDAVRHGGAWHLVTEFVPGGSLEDRLRRAGPLPPAAGLALVDGVLAGLAAVHAAGIVHRDVKPANVLLMPDGTPKIADFGIARLASARTWQGGPERAAQEGAEGTPTQRAGAVHGTPGYMAPEQQAGRAATAASDLYAVGVLLEQAVAPLAPAVRRVARRAQARLPGRRWPSAQAMRDALRDAALTPARPGTAAGSVPPPPGRRGAGGRSRPSAPP